METQTPSWPAPNAAQSPPPPPPPAADGGDDDHDYNPPTPSEQKNALKQILLAVVGIVIALGVFGALTSDTTDSSGPATMTMAQWAGRYGSSDAGMLNRDTGAMAAAANRFDVAGLKSACRTFRRHIATAESHLPTPDAAVTSALRDAYRYYDQAADACIAGDFERSADRLESGSRATRRATNLLSSFN